LLRVLSSYFFIAALLERGNKLLPVGRAEFTLLALLKTPTAMTHSPKEGVKNSQTEVMSARAVNGEQNEQQWGASKQAQNMCENGGEFFLAPERRWLWPQPELWGGRAPAPLNTHHRPVNEGLILTALQALRDITVMSQSKHTFTDAFPLSRVRKVCCPKYGVRSTNIVLHTHMYVLSRPDAIGTDLTRHQRRMELIKNIWHTKVFCYLKIVFMLQLEILNNSYQY
jgi:hypothetical protein